MPPSWNLPVVRSWSTIKMQENISGAVHKESVPLDAEIMLNAPGEARKINLEFSIKKPNNATMGFLFSHKYINWKLKCY